MRSATVRCLLTGTLLACATALTIPAMAARGDSGQESSLHGRLLAKGGKGKKGKAKAKHKKKHKKKHKAKKHKHHKHHVKCGHKHKKHKGHAVYFVNEAWWQLDAEGVWIVIHID